MKLININKEELDRFVLSSNNAHFFKMSAWGEVGISRHYKMHTLGLFDDNDKLVATTLLLEKKILHYATFYAPRGFCLDYNNLDLLAIFIKELKKYIKKHGGLYFRIDPDIILNVLDEQGNILKHYSENENLINHLIKIGAKHKGYTIKFNEASLPRFTFRVNIKDDVQTILDKMHPKTRKVFKNGQPLGIEIYKGNENDVIEFYQTMKETAKRKKLLLEPLNFFLDYYNILNSHKMSDIYVAKVNLGLLINEYQNKINLINENKENLLKNSNKKTASKINDLELQVNKLHKELNELLKYENKDIILSSIITAKCKDKVWLIHGGNKDILQFLNANYWLYYSIMLDSKKDGYDIVDFFGSEGVVNPNSDLYGIYLFKSRFGGEFDEFIGEFDFIVRPFANFIIHKLLTIRRKLLLKKGIKEIQNETN